MSLPRCNSTGGGGTLGSGSIKRRPRPLKMPSSTSLNRLSTMDLLSMEDVIVLMENVTMQLNYQNYDYSVLASLVKLCESLKQIGPQIEALYQDQLDNLAVAFRNSSRSENLDLLSRVHILEIIELRARNWIGNENLNNYYSITGPDFSSHMLSNQTPTILAPADVIASSGRFVVPTKIPGKNYFKDEIVIRNSDSGKVMGLRGRRVHMIEEMTEAVISFQRVVPGARERLVQITGSAPQNIEHAKRLIEETIRRNQSPGREMGMEGSFDSLSLSSDDSRRNTLRADQFPESNVSIQDYKYTVNVGDTSIKITGSSLDLVRTAKLVLDEYFSLSSTPIHEDTQYEDMILRSPALPVKTRSKSSIISPTSSTITRPPLHLIQESNFSTLARSRKENIGRDSPDENMTTLPPYNPLVYSRQDLLRYSMSNHSKVPPGKCDPAYKPWKLQKKGRHFNGCKHAERVNMKDFGGAVISAGRLMSQMDCAED